VKNTEEELLKENHTGLKSKVLDRPTPAGYIFIEFWWSSSSRRRCGTN
jgi:hypothetical protein